MEHLLNVRDLAVSFHTHAGEVKAVRGINFHLDKNETLAFVGESGCGKTVTAKTILRLLKPPFVEIGAESSIEFQGQDVIKMSKKNLQKYRGKDVSMIFQDPMTSLNPTMTCGKQIMESVLLHVTKNKKEAYDIALDTLKMVQIPDPEKRMKQYPHELSGGMRQRIMIAIALSCKPSILIADEPTTALDVTIQAQVIDLLRELKTATKAAVILVTHDLGVVANFADRIQVMYAGKIVERGTAQDIFYKSRHPYTWALLNSVPKLAKERKQALYSLRGTPPDLILPLEHCPFAARCQYCMPICKEVFPEETVIDGQHSVHCFLTHPNAPAVTPLYQMEVSS
ncbi:MAG: ABC transporter ATP-binding protein [Defluviitaleaceae bacterium]|nr:ABC transporter ATP-binding protein [Defluviitaleaceae bacterium]